MNKPSVKNQDAFDRASMEIAAATEHHLADLVTSAPPKDRETETRKAQARAAQRFGPTTTGE